MNYNYHDSFHLFAAVFLLLVLAFIVGSPAIHQETAKYAASAYETMQPSSKQKLLSQPTGDVRESSSSLPELE